MCPIPPATVRTQWAEPLLAASACRRRYCHSLERDKEREYKHAYRKQRTFLSRNRGFAKGGNGTGKPAGSRPARAPESTPGMVA